MPSRHTHSVRVSVAPFAITIALIGSAGTDVQMFALVLGAVVTSYARSELDEVLDHEHDRVVRSLGTEPQARDLDRRLAGLEHVARVVDAIRELLAHLVDRRHAHAGSGGVAFEVLAICARR